MKNIIQTENQNILRGKRDKLGKVTAIAEILHRRYHT